MDADEPNTIDLTPGHSADDPYIIEDSEEEQVHVMNLDSMEIPMVSPFADLDDTDNYLSLDTDHLPFVAINHDNHLELDVNDWDVYMDAL